ncbi:MAG: TolC family protein [Bacteroidales bacterium]
MLNKKIHFLILLITVSFWRIAAQETDAGVLSLSLKEAQEQALQRNKMVISANLDVQASQNALWETISSGLPQVNVSGSFTDNLKLMTTLIPNFFQGKPEEKIPVRFGSQFTAGATVQATTLIFNAPYLIGIETSKVAEKLSRHALQRTELDTKETVAVTYFLILISERSLEIVQNNIANLNETLKSTRAMLAAGMAEQTDVDQMESNVKMVENSRSQLQRTIELNYNMLRFQLGVPAETKIVLKESLTSLALQINVEALLSKEFDYTQNVTYLLTDDQEKMSELALKGQKASILPSLTGFYNYGINGMGDKLKDLPWFKSSMTGLQLSVPIFASGHRYASIRKAQLNLEKAKTVREMVTEQLLIQEKQLRYNLVNANQQYQTQKENVELAKRVYQSMENKFRHGMASSMELSQSNSLYLQAENNYISALFNLFQTKIALDKLLNNL